MPHQAVQTRLGILDCLAIFLQHEILGGVVENERCQPACVHFGPGPMARDHVRNNAIGEVCAHGARARSHHRGGEDDRRVLVTRPLTERSYFCIRRNMEKTNAVAALAALAQDNRLEVFRLLVRAGPHGLSAGEVATSVGLPPNTLTFHFDRLRMAGLVTVRREGRSMIYAAQYDTMNALLAYLTENCCSGNRGSRTSSRPLKLKTPKHGGRALANSKTSG
jgi:ArsR family transcriptional regulator